MGKYEDAKYWVRRKARNLWICFSCDSEIEPGTYYYAETLGLIGPSPGMVFRKVCARCHETFPLPGSSSEA